MVIDKDLILLDLTGDKETMIYNCYEYERPQVTKNTLKDLYEVMDNKQVMQVLLEAKDAKDVIEYLKA